MCWPELKAGQGRGEEKKEPSGRQPMKLARPFTCDSQSDQMWEEGLGFSARQEPGVVVQLES